MTHLLRSMLRADYLQIIMARRMQAHHNATSLAKATGYSNAHIGNIFADRGSDDAIAAVCRVLEIDIRKELFKPVGVPCAQDATGTEG